MTPRPLSLPWRAALIYGAGATAWILLSDGLLALLFGSAETIQALQTFKGVAFVGLTSVLLYLALAAGERRRAQVEASRRAEEARARLLAEYARDIIYHYRLVEPRGFTYVSPAATEVTGYTPEEHYADPDLGRKLVHEDDLPLLGAVEGGATQQPLVLRWRRKDGTVIWTEQRNRPLYGPGGALVGIEGIARDVTAHRHTAEQLARALAAEQGARQAAEQAGGRATRLQAISASLAGALTPEQVVEIMVDHGAPATGAKLALVTMLDPRGEQLEVVAATGHYGELPHDLQRFPLAAELPMAAAVRTREPVWVASRAEAGRSFPALPPLLVRFEAEALVALPLITAGRVIGAVSYGYRDAHGFTADEQTFLLSLAQQCAQVLERTRLFSEVRMGRARMQQLSQRLLEAQERERRHIARELHDEIGQVLGALKINLHLLEGQAEPAARAQLQAESAAILDTLIQQVRSLSLDLRPAVLDDLGLAAALEWYCERIGRRSGLAIQVVAGLGDRTVPPEVATACFRVAQEALSNVVKHAHAAGVTVTLGIQDEMLVLSVYDDGAGFDVTARRAGATAGASLGLISMVERAELAGGWADISSSATGTEVWACFPLARPAEGEAPFTWGAQ